ncbi:P-selectin-like isoform X1 [Xiphophorus couchianus]|uniref:P-selectin-like isoform X1 n=1 Tax=Xiphophorus couchianus TaxID=32473 RepID=UPI0010167839|nr:P-selectin-like isoform X1 [Xiphophorus couchianus]
MKPLWFMFLVLQAFLSVEFSWSQNVNTCEIGVLDPNLYVSGLTPTCGTMKPGHKLCFVCGPDYQLDGSKEIECLPTGQWSASFPSCSEKCRIPDIPSTVRITSSVQGNAISKGDTLSFDCRQQDHIMQGSSTSSCLGNGKWSTPPPECTTAAHCSAPPTLENGDTKLFIRSDAVYQIGDRVEYICQNKYIMDGDPFKTCDKGVWKGNMRCLKPCTVYGESLSEHGITFRFGDETKIYAPHLDHLTFLCVSGKRRVGSVPMRVQCNDGQMTLPTCE